MADSRYDIDNPEYPPAGPQHIPRPDHWKPGPARTWGRPDRHAVEGALARLPPVAASSDAGDMRPSAVLALLAPDGEAADHGYDLLLTRRSQAMTSHSGEISFAGGRLDRGETPTQAALREAHEEVGLDPRLVAVHGQLADFSTNASNSHIVPVVATTERRLDLRQQTVEVDRVLWVPMVDLTRPGVHHSERWRWGASEVEIHFFELFAPYHETIWGATARMLVDLLDRVAEQRSFGRGR